MPGLSSLGVTFPLQGLAVPVFQRCTKLQHGHISDSSHILVSTERGSGGKKKAQAGQEIIQQMLDLVADKGERDWDTLHCAINVVNQVTLLCVSGNSPHAS